MKIPKVAALVREGRRLLDDALKEEGGWKKRAEKMKIEMEHYNSLSSKEGAVVADLVVNRGWSLQKARSCYKTKPVVAKILAWF